MLRGGAGAGSLPAGLPATSASFPGFCLLTPVEAWPLDFSPAAPQQWESTQASSAQPQHLHHVALPPPSRLSPMSIHNRVLWGGSGQQLPLISPTSGLTGDQRWERCDSGDLARAQAASLPGWGKGRTGQGVGIRRKGAGGLQQPGDLQGPGGKGHGWEHGLWLCNLDAPCLSFLSVKWE